MNGFYNIPREQMLRATFPWETLTVWMQAWRGPYVFDEAHAVSTDISTRGGVLAQTSQFASNKLVRPGGYARSDSIVFPDMAASVDPITFLTMSETSTVPGTHRLIMFIDDAEGLPFLPNGQDQPIQPDWFMERGWFRP